MLRRKKENMSKLVDFKCEIQDGIYGEVSTCLPKEVKFLGQKCTKQLHNPVRKHINDLEIM